MTRAALFDVDGTLVDSNHLHVVAWWEALRQGGHQVSTHAVHRAIGLPGEQLLDHLLGRDRDRSHDDRLSGAHDTLYGTFFERLQAFDRAADLLRALADDGWRIVLVTSAKDRELTALRRALDADDVVTATATADDVERGKPAPDPIEHALSLVDVDPDRAVFVGDSVWDMKAARHAGVVRAGLLCGGIPRADLTEAGAAAVYDDPGDLLDHLATSPFAGARVPEAVRTDGRTDGGTR
ncbi:HAD family hydrolase [Streptomyces sp. LMG1-1-1.1]|uniref:HAD family hydrolase n=1 Tax=Streptomyces sp. LMG1-1-1.1 TaxID=3135245 RepID=UPI003465ECDB